MHGYGLMQHKALPDNYWLQNIRKTKHFRRWNVFDDICRMGCWSFWCWCLV